MKKKKLLLFAVVVVLGLVFIHTMNGLGEEEIVDTLPDAEKTAENYTAEEPIVPETPSSVDPFSVKTERDWGQMMSLPSLEEIEAYNSGAVQRSPYLGAWIKTDEINGFIDYFADFRAEFLPCATYCCPVQFDMDYSSLEARYSNVRQEYESCAGYAGLQRQPDGSTNAILSFWDVFCTDSSGAQTVIRPTLVYPENETESEFGGEGTGAHYLPKYDWEAGKWYRIILHCGTSDATGNTTVTMWIVDLDSGKESLMCTYDLGVPDVHFRGDVAMFLENYDPHTAGDVRSMECRNIVVNGLDGYSFYPKDCYISQNYDYPGSYRYGTDGGTLYFITTGVSGKDGGSQEAGWYSIAQ